MLRTDVIQALLNAKKKPAYLEIGVEHGQNFFSIKAGSKTAVDPEFAFSFKEKLRWMYKNPSNLNARYYEATSDGYFETSAGSKGMDVVFIDGLHTYQQSLKDVLNSLRILKDNGIIVMHDCNPPHKAAAFPSQTKEGAAKSNIPGWTGEWCGDVWKTICLLRGTRKDLRAFVLDTDYGLGIVTKGNADEYLNLSPEQVDAMTYDDLAIQREKVLGLKPKEYFFEFLKTLQA